MEKAVYDVTKAVISCDKKYENEQLITSGGRVLTAVGIGKNINEARKIAYQVTNTVKYKNKFMRTDIALNYEEKKWEKYQ